MDQRVVTDNRSGNALSLHIREDIQSVVHSPVFAKTVNYRIVCNHVWLAACLFHFLKQSSSRSSFPNLT
jgi:hypothetical protein